MSSCIFHEVTYFRQEYQHVNAQSQMFLLSVFALTPHPLEVIFYNNALTSCPRGPATAHGVGILTKLYLTII